LSFAVGSDRRVGQRGWERLTRSPWTVVGRITPLVAAVVARRLAALIPAVVMAFLLGTRTVSALLSAVIPIRRTAREA
jgi:hypothetical protein